MDNQNKNKQGKFIVFYGLNNLGKTTQAKLLVDNLKKSGYQAKYFKVPAYEVEPTGHIINDYLRHGNPYDLNPREAQIIYAYNRRQIEDELKQLMSQGVNIVAECYIATGLAWGGARGVDMDFLKHINAKLLTEDLVFYFHGERFDSSYEKGHLHENNAMLTKKAKEIFEKLAQQNRWQKVDANQDITLLAEKIFTATINYLQNTNIKPAAEESLLATGKNNEELEDIQIAYLSPQAKLISRQNGYLYDLYTCDYQTIPPGKKIQIKTGIKLSMPENYIAIVKNLLNHSSFLLNPAENKEITLAFFNANHDAFPISPNQKIGQLMFQKLAKPNILVTKDKIPRHS